MPDHVTKMVRIVSEAVALAQSENRRKGIPNVYVINGKLVWQLSDGTLTVNRPE